MWLNVGFSLCMAPQFLSHHGGSSNACTSAEYTTFFFDVAQDHLCGALDRSVPGQVCSRSGWFQDRLVPGQIGPRTDWSRTGWSQDRLVPGQIGHRTGLSRDRLVPGQIGPRTDWCQDRLVAGQGRPGTGWSQDRVVQDPGSHSEIRTSQIMAKSSWKSIKNVANQRPEFKTFCNLIG